MNTSILLFKIIFLFSSIAGKGDGNLHQSIMEIIRKDIINDTSYKSIRYSLEFEESPQLIPFNIESVFEDIVRKKYVSDFSYQNKSINSKYYINISALKDSIVVVQKKLNLECPINENNKIKQVVKKGNKIILFTSKACNNMIYVEAIPSVGVSLVGSAYEYYGVAKTFLFILDNKKQIVSFYSGSLEYN